MLCIIAGQLPDLEPEGHRFVRHVEVAREIGHCGFESCWAHQPVVTIVLGSQWDVELPRRDRDVVLSGHSNGRRPDMSVIFRIEVERETDGRWLAETVELPGVLAYGATDDRAIARVQALALRVVADRNEGGYCDRSEVKSDDHR